MIGQEQLRYAMTQEDDRIKRFARARQFYDGASPDPLLPTKSDPYAKDNVKLNFSRLIVDVGVDYLFGKGVEFHEEREEEDAVQSVKSPADKWIDAAWKQNCKNLLLTDCGINGGIYGHAFLMLQMPPVGKQYPRIVNVDPVTVTPFWNPDDYEDVYAWKIQWNALDSQRGKIVVRRKLIERSENGTFWTITESQTDSARFRLSDTRLFPQIMDYGRWEDLSVTNWPYAFSPVFHCKNLPNPNEFWGVADLVEDITDTNDSVNFVLSNLKRIIRNHAHPQPVGKGFGGQDVEWGAGGLVKLPGKDAEISYLEMKGDLASSLEMYKLLKEAYHEVSRIPEVATGKVDGIGALSGVALKLLYAPFVSKTQTKQNLYGEMLCQLNCAMYEMGNGTAGVMFENRFGAVVPVDVKESAETAGLLHDLGVSKSTVLSDLGFDPESEKQKRAAEDEEAQQAGLAVMAAMDKGQGMAGSVYPSMPVDKTPSNA